MSKPKVYKNAKLHRIGTQNRTYEQWKEIFRDIPGRNTIDYRIKKGMSFIEAITYIKPNVIYAGEVYNQIEVLDVPINNNKAACKARCHCGKEFSPRISNLKLGTTKSCGCSYTTQNGLSKHPLYATWICMNNRCYNLADISYKNYGAKDVYVCKEWHKDNPHGLENFINDMYPSYLEATKDGLKVQLDKDKLAIPGQPKTYSKDTCCWLTYTDNNRRRKGIKLTVKTARYAKQQLSKGVHYKLIAKELKVHPATIHDLAMGKTWKDVNY